MTSMAKTVPDAPAAQEDGGFSEEVADRQFERMLREAEARLPEGYEYDWERGAVVRLDPSLPLQPYVG